MKKKLETLLVAGILLMVVVVVFFPYFWMILTSLKPLSEFVTYPLRWFPSHLTLEHYVDIFVYDDSFIRSLMNSIVVSVVVTLLNLLLTIPAAFGIRRLRPPGAQGVFAAVLSMQFFPRMVFFVPFYILLANLKLMNSLEGLFISYLAITLPISLLYTTTSFASIPLELEEAARIEGCSDLEVLFSVVLPLGYHGVIVGGMFAFVTSWQEYIFPMLYTTTLKAQTAPYILYYYLGQHHIDYAKLMSAGVVMTLPIMAPFIFIQQRFKAGALIGGVKG